MPSGPRRGAVPLLTALMFVTSCGTSATSTTDVAGGVDSTSAAPPIPTDVVGGVDSTPTSETVAEVPIAVAVADAYYSMRPSSAAEVGLNVLNNTKLKDLLRSCVESHGLSFIDYDTTFASSDIDSPSRNPNGVDAAWHIPPDVDGARIGLGLAGPLDPQYGEEPSDSAATSTTEQDGYTAILNECGSETLDPESFDPTLMEDLLGTFARIGYATKALPGFAALDAQYLSCIQSKGFDFTEPEALLDIAKNHYGSVTTVEGQEYERAIAVADAECREPLYAPFIELNERAWRRVLNERADDIARVAGELVALATAAG